MKKGEQVFLIVGLILFVGFISADFNTGTPGYSIDTQYVQNESLRGWINMSFTSEPSDLLFTDTFGNSISLIELFELNNNSNYECSPLGCENDYMATNPQSSKTFNLDQESVETLGLRFIGNNFESIQSFSLDISSDAGENVDRQLYIDLLADGEIDWYAHRPSGNFYGEDFGCYEESVNSSQIPITDNKYCQQINIPVSPNVEIGAYVVNNGTQSAVDFNFQLCDESLGCETCKATASANGRISCVIDEGVDERKDFYVCMNTQTTGDNQKYKIMSETENVCGYAGNIGNGRDFEIFAKPGTFASVGEFSLNEEELESFGNFIDLPTYVEDYIEERYNNDCSSDCVVPIKFITDKFSQEITVSNIDVDYYASGVPQTSDDIYDLEEISPRITSDFQVLSLNNAGFHVSDDDEGDVDYVLEFDDQEILSEPIFINEAATILSINTQKVIAAYPTEFLVRIKLTSPSNTTVFNWDFGDGKKLTTSENTAIHTYSSLGTFDLKVSVTEANGVTSSRTFTITSETPKNAVSSVLNEKFNDLENIQSQILEFPATHRSSLQEMLNLNEFETELSELQQRSLTAVDDEDYVGIMNDLVSLIIPSSIFETKNIQSVGLQPSEERIDLDVLEEIGGGEYGQSQVDPYLNSIVVWEFENTNVQVSGKEYSALYGDSIEVILSTFNLNVENKADENSFLVISKMENMEFEGNYGQQETLSHYYIPLTAENDNLNIEFSTTEEVSFSELPAFISPALTELTIIDPSTITTAKDRFSIQTIIVLVTIIALFIGFVIYIILQEWYKRKYETYLFKDRNQLYNLVSYIHSAKEKGMKKSDMESKLKSAGWSSEQVNYIMRKYAGKRTGMIEIPIEKIINIFTGKDDTKNVSGKFPKRRY